MAKRGRLKVKNVLIFINVLVLTVILGIYTGRLIKYYKLEHSNSGGDDNTTLLVDVLRKKRSYVDLTKGLVCDKEDNTCRYKGEIKDNYLSYSGMLYRIIGIDHKNNIVAVSENNVTLMYSGLEKGFKDSYVNKWLNSSEEENSGIYEEALYSTDLLDYTDMCNDTITDLEKITCDNIDNEHKITLLTLDDYKEAGGKSSFINNGESYFLASNDSENNVYFITPSGDISVIKNIATVSGVRPVITINYNTELLAGDGKKDNPYIIEKHDIKTLADVYIGNYIKIGDSTFKVVERNEETIKVASTEVLLDGEEKLLKPFGGTSSRFAIKSGSIAEYLNKTYLSSLDIKDSIVESKWYTGSSELGNLDYVNKYTNETSAKVGMLALSDFYVQDIKNVFTISRGIESLDVIMVITSDGNIYSDSIKNSYNVRPAFNLKSDIKIASGKGSEKDPFVLGVTNEED